MTGIAKYFAEVGVSVDNNSLKKVDKYLKDLEKKLSKYSGKANGIVLGISAFSVDQVALTKALGMALDIASKNVTFEVSKFAVNNRNLQAAMLRASRGLGGSGGVFGGGRAHLNANEWNRRNRETNEEWNRRRALMREEARLRAENSRGRIGGSRSTRSSAVAGGVAGSLSHLYGPAIALGLGGYGLSTLNKRNQEVVAAQLQTQAVSTGNGGTVDQGKQSFEWLKSQANRIGFNYLEASGDYNVLTSNLMGSGGTLSQAQNIFKGFAEYGRVNKLTPARQKLVFNALSQIAGKDKLQAEELTKQLGNSLPGAKAIFAEAWQKKTGGNLTGGKSIQALEAAMKKGEVRGDILNYAADIASERSQTGLEKASHASQAEQGRFQNSVSDMAIVASDAGVEEGFVRIFKTLREGIEESKGLVESLSRGFNSATQAWSELFLIPQDLQRMFDGKDSVIADWLWGKGKDGQETLAHMLEIKNMFTNIKDLGKLSYTGLKKLFDLMSENQGLQFFGKPLATLNKGLSSVLALGNGDTTSAGEKAKEFGSGYLDYITSPGRKLVSLLTNPDEDPNAAQSSLSGWLNKTATEGFGSNSWFNSRDTLTEASEVLTGNQMNHAFDNPYSNRPLDPLSAARFDTPANANAIGSQFTAAAQSAAGNTETTNTYNLDIKFEVTGASNGTVDYKAAGEQVAQWFKNELSTTAASFPNNQ